MVLLFVEGKEKLSRKNFQSFAQMNGHPLRINWVLLRCVGDQLYLWRASCWHMHIHIHICFFFFFFEKHISPTYCVAAPPHARSLPIPYINIYIYIFRDGNKNESQIYGKLLNINLSTLCLVWIDFSLYWLEHCLFCKLGHVKFSSVWNMKKHLFFSLRAPMYLYLFHGPCLWFILV